MLVVVFSLVLFVFILGSCFGCFEFKCRMRIRGWWCIGMVIVCWLGFILVVVCVIVVVGLFVLLGYKMSYDVCYYMFVIVLVNIGYMVVE